MDTHARPGSERLSDYDFELPPDLVAQEPPDRRDSSRLLHLQRAGGPVGHHRFSDLPHLLEPGDLLVLNDTRVVPVRVPARRASGARLDVLLLEHAGAGVWSAFVGGGARVKSGETVDLAGAPARIERPAGPGEPWRVDVGGLDVATHLRAVGRAPLPPYIRRDRGPDARDAVDLERYQTIYAQAPGAVAAPTAGLHFTDAVFAAVAARGVETARVTLHVGAGTFLPVKCERLDEHRMHVEHYTVSDAAADAVAQTRARGGRVVAVGTTSLRALEAAAAGGRLAARSGTTDLFIRPGYRFAAVDALLTNFHLPKSTLLMLVAAMVGRQRLHEVYALAIRERYRFFSYGDAMLIT